MKEQEEVTSVLKEGTFIEHYKGKRYVVLGVGLHSETHERMVAYKALYMDPTFGEGAVWFRPLSMFFETVSYENQIKPRFTVISSPETVCNG